MGSNLIFGSSPDHNGFSSSQGTMSIQSSPTEQPKPGLDWEKKALVPTHSALEMIKLHDTGVTLVLIFNYWPHIATVWNE